MRQFAALVLSLALALPAAAQTTLSEASGNWAGSTGTGFTFLARLSRIEDKLRLTIWQGGPGSPAVAEGDPQFDNRVFELGAFSTREALEVLETDRGSILQVVVEFADEEANGHSITQLQFIDNQFTVVGYHHRSEFGVSAGGPATYDCEVDLWNMVTTENGQQRQLEPVAFEALNASEWTWGAAFDRGFCTRTE
jgi:hypothetical protein